MSSYAWIIIDIAKIRGNEVSNRGKLEFCKMVKACWVGRMKIALKDFLLSLERRNHLCIPSHLGYYYPYHRFLEWKISLLIPFFLWDFQIFHSRMRQQSLLRLKNTSILNITSENTFARVVHFHFHSKKKITNKKRPWPTTSDLWLHLPSVCILRHYSKKATSLNEHFIARVSWKCYFQRLTISNISQYTNLKNIILPHLW